MGSENKKLKAFTLKDIDPELFKTFKIACAKNDTTMRKVILDFMRDYPKKKRP